MSRGHTKELLLEIGRKVFLERGYNHAGIECILQEAGVPKGSFYNYFPSKEEFGLQVIDGFAACHEEVLEQHLGNHTIPPLQRLRGYFCYVIDRLGEGNCRKGCLIGNLSQEMADQSERFRARLEEILKTWVARFQACLAEARENGSIPLDTDVRLLAEFWMNAWQGSVMRAKTARSTEPLQTFLRMTIDRFERPS